MKLTTLTLAAAGLVSTLTIGASATLIAYEGFDIGTPDVPNPTNINGLAGTGGGTATWTSSVWTGNDGSYRKVATGLSYGPLVTSPGRARGNVPPGNASTFRNFGAQPASGQYWVSVILDISNTSQSSSVGYSLFDGGNERNFLGKAGFPPVFGGTNNAGASTVSTLNAQAFLLSLYDMSAGRQWHWANPDISSGMPSLASSWNGEAGASLTPFTFDRIRIGSFSDGAPPSSFDELRVGTTYASVVPLVPEPTTLGALAAASLLVARRRR